MKAVPTGRYFRARMRWQTFWAERCNWAKGGDGPFHQFLGLSFGGSCDYTDYWMSEMVSGIFCFKMCDQAADKIDMLLSDHWYTILSAVQHREAK